MTGHQALSFFGTIEILRSKPANISSRGARPVVIQAMGVEGITTLFMVLT